MSGPARAGLFIYAVNSRSVANFYCAIANMTILREREDLIVLQSPDIQLLIHKIPDHIAKDITIESPPLRRENTTLKFFFTVRSIDKAALPVPLSQALITREAAKLQVFYKVC